MNKTVTKMIYTTPDGNLLPKEYVRAALNADITNQPKSTVVLAEGITLDIAECPHLLIAGTTGSGKSVMLHSIICSLLLRNGLNDCEMMLIDPKQVELAPIYDGNPLLRCPVLTSTGEAIRELYGVQEEMNRRYSDMKNRKIRKWDGKRIYVIIDEFAQLVYKGGKSVQDLVANIAFLGRAAGIHLIIAVQHPTADIVSRNITAQITARICLLVDKWSESQLVLGMSGAEKLNGNGDAFLKFRGDPIRFQGLYLDDDSLEAYNKSWILETKTTEE
jgi:S-DNA-T family DNA segregation ATPase FtsK/SpoIIIE